MMDDCVPPPADSYLLQLASAATRLGVSSIWASLGEEVRSAPQRDSATAPSSDHTELPLRSRAVPSGHVRPSSRAVPSIDPVPSGHARPSSRAVPPSRETVRRPERETAVELRAPSRTVPARPSSSAGSIDAAPALEPVLPSPGPTPAPFGAHSHSSQQEPSRSSSRSSRGISTAAASIDAPRRLDFDPPASAASGPAASSPAVSSPATPWHGLPPPPPIDADRVWPDRAEVAQRQGAVVGADAGVFEVPMQLSNLTMGGPPPRAFNLPRGAKKVGRASCTASLTLVLALVLALALTLALTLALSLTKVGQLQSKRPGGAAHSAVYLVVGGGGPRRIVEATGRALSPSVAWQALMPTHRLGLECDEYVQVSACRS